jgi:hypothetical protein
LAEPATAGMVGMTARVLGGPNHGLAGRIISWGADLTLETGRVVPGARLVLAASGSEVQVPLTNLEII